MLEVDIAVDRSFCLLHLLHPRGISYLDLGQATPVQPGHTHYHLLLGDSMSKHGICSVVWLPCGVPHLVRFF